MRQVSNAIPPDDWIAELKDQLTTNDVIKLMKMHRYPELCSLGATIGTEQVCTMKWFDQVLEDIRLPRILLKEHPAYGTMRQKRPRSDAGPSSHSLATTPSSSRDHANHRGSPERSSDDGSREEEEDNLDSLSYQDQIRLGRYFPIMSLVEKQGDEWVLRIRDEASGREPVVTISKFLLKDTHNYGDWFDQHEEAQVPVATSSQSDEVARMFNLTTD